MKNDQDWNEQMKYSASPKDERDSQAYQKVYDALSREPDFMLSSRFADRIIQRIIQRQEKSSSRDMLYLIIGSVLMLMTAIAGALFAGFKADVGVFRFLSGYGGLVIFGIAFILFLHWLDKKIVNKKIAELN